MQHICDVSILRKLSLELMDLVGESCSHMFDLCTEKRKKDRNHLRRLREPINHTQKKGIIASHGPIKLVAFVFVMEAR